MATGQLVYQKMDGLNLDFNDLLPDENEVALIAGISRVEQ